MSYLVLALLFHTENELANRQKVLNHLHWKGYYLFPNNHLLLSPLEIVWHIAKVT